ncbi:MAG TPA: type 1 glutamine amidotransferase [Actinomycetota bacterium]|nr:type 1 glutamine amidotransferase [Actinomycetota bacterium]
MRVLVLKPQELSRTGHVGASLIDRGAEVVEHVLDADGPPPALDGFDAVVVTGAPWSVYGEEVRRWIGDLLERLREAVAREVPVLGICFGAQAFAEANGGWVARARDKEVGLHEVQTDDPDLVPAGPWFMWHGDTFGPPDEATVVARTEAGPQAYTLGPHLLVQFHPEATAEIVSAWLAYDDADFHEAGIDPHATLAELRRNEPDGRARADAFLDRFLGDVNTPA